MEQNTLKTQSVETPKQRTLHLLQCCQEMQDGVIRAQHHNRQLLEQFQEAQGTLREMLTLTAAMKTTRMEYEKHLGGIPQWRQQLHNTQEKRNLNNTGHRAISSPHQPLPSQRSYDGSFHFPHIQYPWMMQPRNPHQPQDSSHAPPHFPSNPLQLHHQASSIISLPQSLPYQNIPDQAWFWTAGSGTPSGLEAQFCVTGPPAESVHQSQTSSPPSSYRKSAGSRNSHSAQELDTQPVRLPCSAESSDGTTEPSQVNRKKRRSSKHTSDGEQHSSPDFQAFSVRTGADGARSAGSSASSKESRPTLKSAGSDGGPMKVENGVTERNNKTNKGSQSSGKESRLEQTGGEESRSQSESSGSVEIKIKNGDLSSRSEGGNEEVKDEEQLQEDLEESENDVRAEEEQGKEEDDSKRINATDDEEKNAGAEEEAEELESEESDGAKDEDSRKLDCASSQKEVDEDESEESEDSSEEDEASDEDNKSQDSTYDEEDEAEEVAEEEKGDEAAQGEAESDSDECIIPLQKSKMLHVIPEEAPEDEDEDEETKPETSEEDSDEFSNDIKDPCAPQQPPETQEKEMKAEQKPKGFYDRMEIFQVGTEEGSSHGGQTSDSDEFDHFFD